MNQDSSVTSESVLSQRVDGVWYMQKPGTAIWGKGDTLDDAYTDLSQRGERYTEFARESGLPVFDAQTGEARTRLTLKSLRRPLLILAFVAFACVPVSYAVSTGIKRGFKNADLAGGRAFWTKVERSILKMGAEGGGLPPAKTEALQKATRNIVTRLRPFSSEFRLLFTPPGQGAKDNTGRE